MKDKYSYLKKNILLFSISGFVPKILSFILVPIYTSYLSPLEYGVADIISTTVLLLVPIFTLDIQDAVMRYSMDKNYDNGDVFTVAIQIIIKGGIIVCIGTYLCYVSDLFSVPEYYYIFFLITYFTTAVSNTISLFCRGLDKVSVMVVSGILNSVITLSLNILFLIRFNMGLIGYLLANSIGSIFSVIFIFIAARLYTYIHIATSRKVETEMIGFSFPLIFSVVAWWVNNASDRYILTWMSGLAVSGIYAVAYKIPTLLTVFQNIFAQAWSISAIREFDSEDKDGFIGNIYTMMNGTMIISCSAIMVGNIIFSRVLFSNEFFSAWEYVPPLLISVVFNAMALFIGSIFTAVKDTKTLSISTIIGALTNMIGNFSLIYFFDAYGAALATMLGYFVTLVMRLKILKKHIRIKRNVNREIFVYIVLIIQMILARFGIIGIGLQIIPFAIILLTYKMEIKQVYLRLKYE